MPYFCYNHHGLYVRGDEDKCYHAECIAFARKDVRPVGLHFNGSSGSRSQKVSRANSVQFHKDMYAFKDAADQGVSPDQVTAVAAEAALKQAEAQV